MNTPLKLEGSKDLIQGMVAIIDSLNNNSRMGFHYLVDLAGPNAFIEITSEKPEHFFTLGIASHELLRKAFSVR